MLLNVMLMCDIAYAVIYDMISLYLDSLPGPLSAENGLQDRVSDPKFR